MKMALLPTARPDNIMARYMVAESIGKHYTSPMAYAAELWRVEGIRGWVHTGEQLSLSCLASATVVKGFLSR